MLADLTGNELGTGKRSQVAHVRHTPEAAYPECLNRSVGQGFKTAGAMHRMLLGPSRMTGCARNLDPGQQGRSQCGMTQDDRGQQTGPTPGQPPDGQWLTLTDAAARCGHTREALRQRVRRGNLRVIKGNDGRLRIHARDLTDLPPPDVSADDPGQTPDTTRDATGDDPGQHGDATVDATLDILAATLADLARTRTVLDVVQADHLADRGRAERAEAQAAAEARRADAAEARLAAAEAALTEARLPWIVRVVRAMRLIPPVAPTWPASEETKPASPAAIPVPLPSPGRAGIGR